MTEIWSMVREEMCSEVVGSKRIMLPCVLPDQPCQRGAEAGHTESGAEEGPTKGNIAIAHPCGDGKVLVRGEAGDLVPRHEIPHYGRLPGIVAHNQAASTNLTEVVHGEQLHLFGVPGEPPLNGERVMMAADNRGALSIEKHGCRGSARDKEPQILDGRHGCGILRVGTACG